MGSNIMEHFARVAMKRTRNMEALLAAGDDIAAEGGEKRRAADRIIGSGEEEGKETMRSASVSSSSTHQHVLCVIAISEVRVSIECVQVDICFTEADCVAPTTVSCRIEGEEIQKHEEKSILLAMVLLLVISAKSTFPCRQLIMETLRSIRRFLSSSVLQLQSFVLQGILAAMPALLTRK